MSRSILLLAVAAASGAGTAAAQDPFLEPPALGLLRVQQSDIQDGSLSLDEIRTSGLRVFSAPFNRADGFGDGPMNPIDPTSPGGRPALQSSEGAFLRVNGLDAQSCLECHGVVSSLSIPARFGVGGHGTGNNNVIAGPTNIDVDDEAGNSMAAMDGRFINPPFVFGAGGVEMLAKEMTRELQRRAARAQGSPGANVPLVAKGISFGSIRFDSTTQSFDTSNVEGVDDDLVIKPFGRKGDNATVRQFAQGAMQFHFGMQPSEIVGINTDADGDGKFDEILPGELSALHVFAVSLERPEVRDVTPDAITGALNFQFAGCATCHVPALETRSSLLPLAFPEVHTDPLQNQYYRVDLENGPAGFQSNGNGGVVVPLFSDLKRHDMGSKLAESTGGALDSEFITARLWGIADSGPYMHDGRALTLHSAILMHGGEAQAAANAYVVMPLLEKQRLLAFLGTLRTPTDPAGDIVD